MADLGEWSEGVNVSENDVAYIRAGNLQMFFVATEDHRSSGDNRPDTVDLVHMLEIAGLDITPTAISDALLEMLQGRDNGQYYLLVNKT